MAESGYGYCANCGERLADWQDRCHKCKAPNQHLRARPEPTAAAIQQQATRTVRGLWIATLIVVVVLFAICVLLVFTSTIEMRPAK